MATVVNGSRSAPRRFLTHFKRRMRGVSMVTTSLAPSIRLSWQYFICWYLMARREPRPAQTVAKHKRLKGDSL